jgi:hypothetical protein
MSDTQTVTLPNGQLIENVPVGTSQDELKRKLIESGRVTEDAFVVQPKTDKTEKPDLPWYKDVYYFVKNNLDIPASMYGGVKGAKFGSRFGPKGAAVFGVLGSGMGAFGGDVTSSFLNPEEEVDYGKSVEESLIGMGFDVATLGAWKVLKPMALSVGKRYGFSPDQTAALMAQQLSQEGTQVGTRESLTATQQILQQKGATLTRFQTGEASATEVFAEKLGEAGLFSGRESAKNISKVNEAIQSALNDVTGAYPIRTGDSPVDLGEAVLDIITAGRYAASDAYGEGLEEITKTLSQKSVDITPLRNQLLAFKNANSVVSTGVEAGKKVTTRNTLLSKETNDFINEQLNNILKYPNMTGEALLKIDKMLTNEMKRFGDIRSPNYNTAVDKQMGELQNNIKQGILDILRKTDPEAAKSYEVLKNTYSETMKGILPVINANIVKSAEKGVYDSIGKLLTTSSSVSKINAMLASIDNAYAQLAKTKQINNEIPYGSAKEAKNAIRQSFLKNLIPKMDSPDFDISTYADLAARFQRPAEKARLKAIMGEDYAQVNQLLNAMAEASKRPDGNLGVLFLRGKEFQTGSELFKAGQGVALGVSTTASLPVALGSAAFILGSPIFLSKLAYSPKAVNRLLAFNKQKFKDDAARETAAMLIVSDVINGLSSEEAAQLKADLGIIEE